MVNVASSFRPGQPPAPHLVLRADAGGLRGSGHVMRCLALAGAWIDAGGTVTLAAAELPAPMAARAEAEGVAVVKLPVAAGSPDDAAATRDVALSSAATALVVDGYHFDAGFFSAVAAAAPTCVIDDGAHVARYPVRWILNQNAHAQPALYDGKAGGAELLLGGAYALLRREFAAPQATARRGLFATFGGVDPHGASDVFLDAYARLGAAAGIEATLAIGAANPDAERLAARAMSVGVTPARDVRDMAVRFAQAELVVTAGGSTLWEGCACAAPMLALSVIPEEAESAAALAARGGCRYVGPRAGLAPEDIAAAIAELWSDAPARAALGRNARALVDGQGAARVAAILKGVSTPR